MTLHSELQPNKLQPNELQQNQTQPDEIHRTDIETGGTADPGATLRRFLRANGGFSLITGAVAALDAGPIGDFIGVDQTWLIRAIGVGLIGFAAMLFVLARQPDRLIKRVAPLISEADLAWVLATVVIIAFGLLSTEGAVLMGAVAVPVLVFAIGQWRSARRIADDR
ncbi:MAG: hypothetical protein ACR2QK_24960 [Acidimicrobiales bacterium]